MKSVLVLVNTDRNFTPASLMQIYARQAAGALFERGRFGEAQLILSGTAYRYHHWSIGEGVVTLFLEEVSAC